MAIGATELISKCEYARRRGCSEAAVRRAISDGRITAVGGKIDPKLADEQWARNTRVRMGSRPAQDAGLLAGPIERSATPEPRQPPAAEAMRDAAPPAPASAPRDDPNGYQASKARREQAEAAQAELKLAEIQGRLVLRSAVEAVHARYAARFRESLLELAARVTPQIVGIVGLHGDRAREQEAKIRSLLETEHHQALTQFAGASDGRV